MNYDSGTEHRVHLDHFRKVASGPDEKRTLEACFVCGKHGRIAHAKIYFEIHEMTRENLSRMLYGAIISDRVDLVAEYIDRFDSSLVEGFFKVACSYYSQECSEYLAYCPYIRIDEETRNRWLKNHGSPEERYATIKRNVKVNWGPSDKILHGINAEGPGATKLAIKPYMTPDEAENVYALIRAYGCRNPEVFMRAAKISEKEQKKILADTIMWGRTDLFIYALEKLGHPDQIEIYAEFAAMEGRTPILMYMAAHGVLDNLDTWRSCRDNAEFSQRLACLKFLNEIGWVLRHTQEPQNNLPAFFQSSLEGSIGASPKTNSSAAEEEQTPSRRRLSLCKMSNT